MLENTQRKKERISESADSCTDRAQKKSSAIVSHGVNACWVIVSHGVSECLLGGMKKVPAICSGGLARTAEQNREKEGDNTNSILCKP